MRLPALAAVSALALPLVGSAQSPGPSHFHVPDTVSLAWQEQLRAFPDPSQAPWMPGPNDIAGWTKVQRAMELWGAKRSEAFVARVGASVTPRELGGVPALEIRPKGWRDDGSLIVYLHGGAYTTQSARSTLRNSALVADATGRRVLSVDYTLAPHARWPQVTDEVLAVFAALAEQGPPLAKIALHGDSAGGGLAAGSVLKMRDRGLGMPAAVVLWSPWSDVTRSGDSYVTLAAAEPRYAYERHLKPAAAAYADPRDQRHPYVSPVYGDYSPGFPPTLIQGGTKEIFLSNFVRQYQAIDAAGQTAKLDLYEGMPHVFQPWLPDSPESKAALAKVRAFLDRHLGG